MIFWIQLRYLARSFPFFLFFSPLPFFTLAPRPEDRNLAFLLGNRGAARLFSLLALPGFLAPSRSLPLPPPFTSATRRCVRTVMGEIFLPRGDLRAMGSLFFSLRAWRHRIHDSSPRFPPSERRPIVESWQDLFFSLWRDENAGLLFFLSRAVGR